MVLLNLVVRASVNSHIADKDLVVQFNLYLMRNAGEKIWFYPSLPESLREARFHPNAMQQPTIYYSHKELHIIHLLSAKLKYKSGSKQ